VGGARRASSPEEVFRAEDELLIEGRHPSINRVRVRLGRAPPTRFIITCVAARRRSGEQPHVSWRSEIIAERYGWIAVAINPVAGPQPRPARGHRARGTAGSSGANMRSMSSIDRPRFWCCLAPAAIRFRFGLCRMTIDALSFSTEGARVRWHSEFQAGLPLDRPHRLPNVYRSTDHNEITP
jgi:hypothetical protein